MNRFLRIASFVLMGLFLASYSFLGAQTSLTSPIPKLGRDRAGLERRSLFLNAWVDADSEARARARRVLQLERDGADRISATPTVRALTKAWDALVHPEVDPFKPDPIRELALSLDLRVVPGFFTGQPEGEPQALTVRVAPLYATDIDVPVYISLFWVGEDGVELRARTEVVAPKAFTGAGFLMYVRAPTVIPGVWKLTCQIDLKEAKARGLSVPVVGLDEPKALIEGADLATQAQFSLLSEEGIRPTFFQSFLESIGVLPSNDREATWLGARLNGFDEGPLRELAKAGRQVWSVGAEAVSSPKKIILLLRPEDELPEAALVGALGEAWQAVGTENSWWVLSTDLRLRSDQGASLLSLATQLRAWKPDAELVLVGRGTALLELQMAQLHQVDWPFERLVLSTVLSPNTRPKKLPEIRGMIVTSDAGTRAETPLDLPGDWAWKKRTDPLVVTDLSLPGLVAAWLARK